MAGWHRNSTCSLHRIETPPVMFSRQLHTHAGSEDWQGQEGQAACQQGQVAPCQLSRLGTPHAHRLTVVIIHGCWFLTVASTPCRFISKLFLRGDSVILVLRCAVRRAHPLVTSDDGSHSSTYTLPPHHADRVYSSFQEPEVGGARHQRQTLNAERTAMLPVDRLPCLWCVCKFVCCGATRALLLHLSFVQTFRQSINGCKHQRLYL
jgi:hypothetical protein